MLFASRSGFTCFDIFLIWFPLLVYQKISEDIGRARGFLPRFAIELLWFALKRAGQLWRSGD